MKINKSSSSVIERSVMRRLLALALCALLTAVVLPSRAPASATSSLRDAPADEAELYQALLDLTNPWTVMCVAAHPDDEDGATLTVLRRKYGAHTVSLFSTYGEGGQNATGPELYEELGAIRERETREASAIQGSEPHFLGLRDFGFSKSADEAFSVWGHEEALRLMVLQIRQLRPDVIITNHDTASGHGHHQATGRLIQEAFDAAADPARFPEQLHTGGPSVWQAQRLFVRVRSANAAEASKTDEAQRAVTLVSIDANERDAVRGSTYAEQALSALQRHATQGPWPQTVPAGGLSPIRYRLVRSSKQAAPLPPQASSVLDGMSLTGAVSAGISPLAAKALLPLYSSNGTSQRGGRVFDALITAREGGLFAFPPGDKPRFVLMSERLDHALAVASGVSIKVEPRGEPLIQGSPASFNIALSNRGGAEITAQSISFIGGGLPALSLLKEPVRVASGKTFVAEARRDHTNGLSINVPRSEHLYDGRVSGEPLLADAVVKLNGAQFKIAANTMVDVAPAVEIASLSPSPLVVTPSLVKSNFSGGPPTSFTASGPPGPDANQIVTFSLRLINHQDTPFEGEIIAVKPDGKDFLLDRKVALPAQGSLDMKVSVGRSPGIMDFAQSGSRPNTISFLVRRANASTTITERKVAVVWADAKVNPRLRVGYIRSFDDTLRDALAALGVESKELTVDDVRAGKLQGYDTIIVDNRGYQAHPELVSANARLLEYASAGGTLVVFYNKPNEWNPDPKKDRPQLAPYPITLGNERVTDENAAVAFLDPQHQLLNSPNKLTQDDFKGWIQERGLYYPQEWDDRYSAPLASSDAGEEPLRGGLLAVEYGRGRYVYTSMVWYRQLRAGIPGAYRMLANMLSYGHADKSATRARVQ